MKILLLKDVAKVGQKGSIKEVSDGYGLNYLIPNSMAVQATPDKVAAHAAAEKKEGEAREMEHRALAAMIKSVEGARIEIQARATEKGGLFKSITAADIAKAILEQRRVKLPEGAITLEKPIKETGEHSITIRASDVEAHVVLAIVPVKN